MKIYCDGIFDLFHKGHLEHFKKIHKLFNEEINLTVGIISDKVASSYKRKPIFNETQRLAILNSCKYINEVFITDMLVIDNQFMNLHAIDYVVHAFNNSDDKSKQNEFFQIPIEMGKFIEIPYNLGISTTEIIKETKLNWDQIWEKKGNLTTNDLFTLNGWESTSFNPEDFVKSVIQDLQIKYDNSILEVGCGSGLIALYLNKYKYIGIDSSLSLVTKHINILNNIVLHFNSTDIIFKTKYFDYTIINSVLEYMNNMDDVIQTLNDIERVSIKGIYIGNIREHTHLEKLDKHKYEGTFTHLVIDRNFFITRGYNITKSLYDNNRYNAFIIL